MIQDRFERKQRTPGALTISLLLLGLLMALAGLLRKGEPKDGLAFKGRSGSDAAARQFENNSLKESVVTILQAYYVDKERVAYLELIRGTIGTLVYAIPELRQTGSERAISLKINDQVLDIDLMKDYSMTDLVSDLQRTEKFCETTKLFSLVTLSAQAMLGNERNCPTIILNAMLSSLDAHSNLMSADSYLELKQGTEGSFGGLGVLVSVKNQFLTVVKPMAHSPAVKAGVLPNDKIIEIDGHPTFGLSLDDLITHMKGNPGSLASLSILRQGGVAPLELKIRREIIEVDSVEYREHHVGDLHYLQLIVESFSARTSREVKDAIRKYRAKYPLHGLVLDLRSNPGGLLDQAVEVSDLFLKGGTIVSTKGRTEEVEKASKGGDELDFPIVVVMNEDSASASEIVAGALQDNGRAVVVGQPSFGKGSVQTLFELPEDRALKLTIARYFTPSNKSIQNIGIMPDVWVQPVFKNSENANLLGAFRYRNEAFLPNHLAAQSRADTSETSRPLLKGFYLKNRKQDDIDLAKQPDFELSVAETIIGKSHILYGGKLPESAQRSSHQLAVALNLLRDQLNRNSKLVSDWILTHHGIVWAESVASMKEGLKLKVSDKPIIAKNGESILVPWEVANLGPTAKDRVSIFLQGPLVGIETMEHIIGHIDGNQLKKGSVKIRVPTGLAKGSYRLVAGVAIDGVAIDNSLNNFELDIESKTFATLSVSTDFKDGVDSLIKGTIEPGENGKIIVTVKNESNQELTDLDMDIRSLSGSQVLVTGLDSKNMTLPSLGSLSFEIPISASRKLLSNKAQFGIVIHSSGILSAFTKVAKVQCAPGTKEKMISGLSH